MRVVNDGSGAGAVASLGAGGVALLHPQEQVFTAMLTGWRNQQPTRRLAFTTVEQLERMARAFAAHAQAYPWPSVIFRLRNSGPRQPPLWLVAVTPDEAVTDLQDDGVMLPSTELFAETRQARPDLPPVVLLHGSGQDEKSLLDFAEAACPGHTLIAVRGRIPWEGGFAFFRRRPDRTLDEADLAQGAAAIQRLLARLGEKHHLPPILLGYSNGAIAATAAILSDCWVSTGAILLRPLSPLADRPFPPLKDYPVLLVSGQDDERRDPSDGPSLGRQFKAAGAATTTVVLPVGHGLTAADRDAVKSWLRGTSDQPAAP